MKQAESTTKYDFEQIDIIIKCHEIQHADWGAERTYNRMIFLFSDTTKKWLTLQKYVCDFVKICPK